MNRGLSILTIIERKSRYVHLVLLRSKASSAVMREIKSYLSNLQIKALTITYDRGLEFAHHKETGVSSYFCNPGSPWQKGSVENMNGRIRNLLPKNIGHRMLTQSMLTEVEYKLNNTPMKTLKYRTPREVLETQN